MTDTYTQLKKGYADFKTNYYPQHQTHFQELASQGQSPKVFVISCCDSRVNPDVITQSHHGDIFMVRSVANLVPPFEDNPQFHGTSAAIEYATRFLKIKDLLLIGHSQCGGIKALIDHSYENIDNHFITDWMSIADDALKQVKINHPELSGEQLQCHCEREALLVSINNLMTYPWIPELIHKGELRIHAWHFDVATAEIAEYDAQTNTFKPLETT